MTRNIFFILTILIFSNLTDLFGQDTLFTTNGRQRIVYVKSISSEKITFTDINDRTKLKSINRLSILEIRYSNGTKETIGQIKISKKNLTRIPDTLNMYEKGREYANLYGKTSGTFIASLFIITIGPALMGTISDSGYPLLLCPAASIAMIAFPGNKLQVIPDMSLFENEDFRRGYLKKLRGKKRIAVISGFFTGLAIDAGLIFLINRAAN